MTWARILFFSIGIYLIFINVAFSHHLSGSTSVTRGTSRRISTGRVNGNRLMRIHTPSATINRQFPRTSRTNLRTSQSAATSSLQQEVASLRRRLDLAENQRTSQSATMRASQNTATSSLQQEVASLRRRLALAEEHNLRSMASRQRLNQIQSSSARQVPQSRGTTRRISRGPATSSRSFSQNTNRRRISSRLDSGPQIVIELDREAQQPRDPFYDVDVNRQRNNGNNNNNDNNNNNNNNNRNNNVASDQQLIEMLQGLLANNPSPGNQNNNNNINNNNNNNNNNLNDINRLLLQLQTDPRLASSFQNVRQAPPRPPPTQPTLWQQVQSLSDPIKARELRLKDPLHYSFLMSILEGDSPDIPDVPDPLPQHVHSPPTTAAPKVVKVEQKVQNVAVVSPVSTVKAKKDIVKKSKVSQSATTKVKRGSVQHLAETPVFKSIGAKSASNGNQPKVIVIRESATGGTPLVLQTDKFGQQSIVIDTGNPQLRELLQKQPEAVKIKQKVKSVVPASNIATKSVAAVDAKVAASSPVVEKTVEAKISTNKSGAVTVKKEVKTNTVSQTGQVKTETKVVAKNLAVTTVAAVTAEVTTMPAETTEAP